MQARNFVNYAVVDDNYIKYVEVIKSPRKHLCAEHGDDDDDDDDYCHYYRSNRALPLIYRAKVALYRVLEISICRQTTMRPPRGSDRGYRGRTCYECIEHCFVPRLKLINTRIVAEELISSKSWQQAEQESSLSAWVEWRACSRSRPPARPPARQARPRAT